MAECPTSPAVQGLTGVVEEAPVRTNGKTSQGMVKPPGAVRSTFSLTRYLCLPFQIPKRPWIFSPADMDEQY